VYRFINIQDINFGPMVKFCVSGFVKGYPDDQSLSTHM